MFKNAKVHSELSSRNVEDLELRQGIGGVKVRDYYVAKQSESLLLYLLQLLAHVRLIG